MINSHLGSICSRAEKISLTRMGIFGASLKVGTMMDSSGLSVKNTASPLSELPPNHILWCHSIITKIRK
jgi:hypothetical protein